MLALDQLRTLLELSRQGFSVTETARALNTSQPGISRRLLALEEKLGVELLVRRGRHIRGFSEIGRQVAERAESLLRHLDEIGQMVAEFRNDSGGELSLVTTHTQARYALPNTVARFSERYPDVRLQIYQAPPKQMAAMVRDSAVDLAIATESFEHFDDLTVLPCYRWRRCLVVPKAHPLASAGSLSSLAALKNERLITYSFGLAGEQGLYQAFQKQGLQPTIAIAVADAEVIKSYVRSGFGLGIVAGMAVDAERDADLVTLDASRFFPAQMTSIAVRRDSRLRSFASFFIEVFAPHLTVEMLEKARRCGNRQQMQALFADTELKLR